VPGRGPIYFAAQIDDTGSGVDPASIQVSLDGEPLTAAVIDFQAETGVLTVTLVNTTWEARASDGLKTWRVAARLCRKSLRYSIGFQSTTRPCS
jgi:hypothetical protein